MVKFRAWDKINARIVDWREIRSWRRSIGDLVTEPNLVTMDYTGAQDKNNVEIYEEDILKISMTERTIRSWKRELEPVKVVVTYDNLGWSCSGGEGKSLYNYKTMDMTEIEVIGNRYENPELYREVNNE